MDPGKLRTNNRLTVIGSKRQVSLFQSSNWERRVGARFVELWENLPRRFSCTFMTVEAPLKSLRSLSRRWPGLVFLLDYEMERKRIKGSAKSSAGELEHHKIRY